MPDRDPRTPAARALLDQIDAATAHAERLVRADVDRHRGTIDVAPLGRWRAAIISSVAPPHRPQLCRHLLVTGLRVRPVGIILPGFLACRPCFRGALNMRREAGLQRQCERCGRSSADGFELVIALTCSGLLMAQGDLCTHCLQIEKAGV